MAFVATARRAKRASQAVTGVLMADAREVVDHAANVALAVAGCMTGNRRVGGLFLGRLRKSLTPIDLISCR
jgi:hypothetical protein